MANSSNNKVLPSEFPAVYHRPAPRRFSGLLRPSGAAYTAYRFYRGASGTAFDRFYVASPVCQPNRASLMTGRMPSVHDVRCNGIPLSMEAVTFVDLLRDAGYRTALIGKSHLQNFTADDPIIKRPPPREGFHEPSQALRAIAARSSGRAEIRARDAAAIGQKPGAHVQTPFYGFEHVTLVRAHGDDAGRRLRPLAGGARSQGEGFARAGQQPAARLHACRRRTARRSRKSFMQRRFSASAPARISMTPTTMRRSS